MPNSSTATPHPTARFGLCTFSCHRQWEAVRSKQPGTHFTDAVSFLDYARSLGAAGVQTRVGTQAEADAMRARSEQFGTYYEGDLRLPKAASDVAAFDRDVGLARAAGATVARTVLTGGRRYEALKSIADFRAYQKQSLQSLHLAEPVLKKHGLKLAVENHKDQTVPEFLALLRQISSQWIGICVDTGNNIALLEEPHAVVEALAPLAFSVHLKDMAVQPAEDGFLLSEVPLGTGFLDLKHLIRVLQNANPAIVFNVEMGTRDPLHVPCLAPAYWTTFPDRNALDLAHAMALVKQHPPASPPPSISGKDMATQIADEEANNRACLAWTKALADG